MADNILSLILRAKDEATGEVHKLSKSLDSLGTSASGAHGKMTLMQGAVAGIAAGATMGAIGAVQGAVSGLSSAMEGVVKGAMDDERSVARLGIVLRDNIPTWKGNTDAIEAAVHARVGLGFEDEKLRDSIGTLVTRTGDVNQALGLQSLAMDIARFKGVDLEAATTAVGRAYSGSATALQRMGIAITAGATGAEALRQATAALAGQAESYATTTLGKVEVAQARFSESMDDLGAVALPLVADAASNLTTVIDLLSGALGGGSDKTNDYGMKLDIVDTALSAVTFGMSRTFAETMNLAEAQKVAEANAVAFADSVDADRVALGAEAQATDISTSAAYAQIDAYTVATHSADERADAEWGLTAALRARQSADAARIVNQTTLAGLIKSERADARTPADLAAEYTGLARVAQAERDAASATNLHTGSTAGATTAATKLAAAVKADLSRAYETFKTQATAALDAIHDKTLRGIADAQKLADKQYEAARAAISGPVDAARAALDATRSQRDLADAQQAVTDAMVSGDQAQMASAQRRLGDLQADQNIAAMEREATAKITALTDAKKAADQVREDQAKAEEESYKAKKTALDKQLTLLKQSLDDQKASWAVHLNAVLRVIGDKDAAFKAAGKASGKAYADAVAAAIAAALAAAAAAAAASPGKPPAASPAASPVPSSGTPAPGGRTVPIEGPKARATGGPVEAGRPYVVGEKRAEVFVPASAGTILPDVGGGVSIGTITIQAGYLAGSEVEAQRFARDIYARIQQEARRQGPIARVA
jgi:hypothetical protein